MKFQNHPNIPERPKKFVTGVLLSMLLLPGIILSLGADPLPFDRYLSGFDYPEVKSRIGVTERRELNLLKFEAWKPVYPGRSIRLYLIASGVSGAGELEGHIGKYDGLLEKARSILRVKGLNEYNRAEFLLHFLHMYLFFRELTGPESGYNTGIREVFENNQFNCYKSALVYNSFLDEFGYRAFCVMVPGHIYSTVHIRGKEVEVETTSRYGFDPHERGLPEYKRLFDGENIRFEPRRYESARPLDRVSVLVQVYNNRAVLMAEKRLPDHPGGEERSMFRAAALSLMGGYINAGREEYIHGTMINALFSISRDALSSDAGLVDREFRRFGAVLRMPVMAKLRRDFTYNLESIIAQAIERETSGKVSLLATNRVQGSFMLYSSSLKKAGSYIRENPDMMERLLNNFLHGYHSLAERDISRNDLAGVMKYGRAVMRYFALPQTAGSPRMKELKGRFTANLTVLISNLGVGHMNTGSWKEADQLYTRGLLFLREEMGVTDERALEPVLRNHAVVRERLSRPK